MAEEKKVATATYVVQQQNGTFEGDEFSWHDIATVKPGDEPLRLRVLDARSAHVSMVTAEQAAPKVVIA